MSQVTPNSAITTVKVYSVGLQGPAGSSGSLQESNSGSFSITGSLTVSGSNAFTNIGPAVFSGSVISTGGFTGSLSGSVSNAESSSYSNYAVSASHALTSDSVVSASYATNALSSSNAINANLINVEATAANTLFKLALVTTGAGNNKNVYQDSDTLKGTYNTSTNTLTADTFDGNATTATSASYAATASFLDTPVTIFPYSGSAQITGSLGVTGSFSVSGSDAIINGLTFGRGNGNCINNFAVGVNSLYSITTGTNNTMVGTRTGRFITTGAANTALGYNALVSDSVGGRNTAIGQQALFSNQSGSFNTAVGYNALQSTLCSNNTGIGTNALCKNTTGIKNTGIGISSLFNTTSGSSNTALGYRAGSYNVGGCGNVFVGQCAGPTTGIPSDNKLFIHNNVSDTPLICGDFNSRDLTFNSDVIITSSLAVNGLISSSLIPAGPYVSGTSSFDLGSPTAAWNSLYLANGTIYLIGNGSTGSISYNDTTGAFNFQGTVGGGGTFLAGLSTALGENAFCCNSVGDSNTAIGRRSLRVNTSGSNNTGLGDEALCSNTIGNFNTSLGSLSLRANSTGGGNVAVGYGSMIANTSGSNNTAIGTNALDSNIDGGSNTAVGISALNNLTTGFGNIALGNSAGAQLTDGSSNIFIGGNAGASGSASNKLFIHNSSVQNPLICGDFSSRELTFNGNVTISGSLSGSVSNADTASTASYINPTFISSSAAASGFGGTTDTGSLMVTGSVASNTLTFTKGDGSTFDLTVATGSGGGGSAFPFSGSAVINPGSLVISGSGFPSEGLQVYNGGDTNFLVKSQAGAVNSTIEGGGPVSWYLKTTATQFGYISNMFIHTTGSGMSDGSGLGSISFGQSGTDSFGSISGLLKGVNKSQINIYSSTGGAPGFDGLPDISFISASLIDVNRKIETDQDIEITDSSKGIILKSPGGTRYRVTVDNSGNLITTSI